MTEVQVDQLQKLMLRLVHLMIDKGPDDSAVDRFIEENRANAEFVRLANVSRRMKRAAVRPDPVVLAAARAGR